MKDIDLKIREALQKQDSKMLEYYNEEQSILNTVFETFRNQHYLINIWAFAAMFIMMGLEIFLAIRFFNTEDVRMLIFYATSFMLVATGIIGVKIWFWMEMERNIIVREIKRLELQVVQLRSETELNQ